MSNNLQNSLNELVSFIPNANHLNPDVSNANVGWHIDHSLLVINKILSQLEKSDENDYRWQFNLKRTVVFFQNKFPVGKAKAPEAVKPTEMFDKNKTLIFAEKAKNKILSAHLLHKNKNFKHPFFGLLNTKHTLKFLTIHTNHHIQIINNILK